MAALAASHGNESFGGFRIAFIADWPSKSSTGSVGGRLQKTANASPTGLADFGNETVLELDIRGISEICEGESSDR